MAQARDYTDYLEERYGFALANSQEEVIAAQTIAEALTEHGLKTEIEEFSAPKWGRRLYAIPMIFLFIAVFLTFFGGAAGVIGILLVLANVVFLAGYYLQMFDPLSKLGPKAQSQNVIAHFEAQPAPEDERPRRPIIILAHYDTGREEILSRPVFAPWRARLVSYTVYTVPAAALLTIISLIPFPSAIRTFFHIPALIATLPTLLWGVSEISAMVGPLTAGSVDNKSSIAAMLSLADKVCYGHAWHPGDEAKDDLENVLDQQPKQNKDLEAELKQEEAAEDAREQQLAEQLSGNESDVSGIGGETIAMPSITSEPVADFVAEAAAATSTNDPESPFLASDAELKAAALAALNGQNEIEFDARADEATQSFDPNEGTSQVAEAEAPAQPSEASSEEASDAPVYEGPEPVRHGAQFVRELGVLPDSCELVYTDAEGKQVAESAAVAAPQEEAAAPVAAQNAPAPSFENDTLSARRNALYELSDPSGRSVDPFANVNASEPQSNPIPPVTSNVVDTGDYAGNFGVIQPGEGVSPVIPEPMKQTTQRSYGALSDIFGDAHNTSPELNKNDDSWKGGATRSDKLRFVPSIDEADAADGAAEAANVETPLPGFDETDALNDVATSEPTATSEELDIPDAEPQMVHTVVSAGTSPVEPADTFEDVAQPEVSSDPDATILAPISELPSFGEAQEETPVYDALADAPASDPASTVSSIFAEESAAVERQRRGFEGVPEAEFELIEEDFAEEGQLQDQPQDPFADATPDALPQEPEAAFADTTDTTNSDSKVIPIFTNGTDEKTQIEDVPAPFMGYVPMEDIDDGVDFELIESITAMGDADLRAHDIYFVAVGASELNHAGAADFIEKHRRELRGAFVINLNSVGSGDLTVITDEGVVPHRRSDRRIVRFLSASADLLHISLNQASITWGDTDAMAMMRRSSRSATIMGCSVPGVPALSHTSNDVPGTINKRKVAETVEIIAEAIRRS